MLAHDRTDWGCPAMDLDPEHTPPTSASNWHWGGQCRPSACSERPRASADTSVLADRLNFSVWRVGQEKHVAPHVDVAMQMAMSPGKPDRAAHPFVCFGASPAGCCCSQHSVECQMV
eukprot:2026431-Pyramimonas_sp.AAC.1